MNSLNFNNLKKHYLSVTLADEKATTLLIGTPTKKAMDELFNLKDSLESFKNDNTNMEALDGLYSACAVVMSRNKAGKEITKEFLEELFDIEDIIIFFESYMDFVGEISDSKN